MPKVNLVALAKLFVGLYLFGWGVALMVHAAIGGMCCALALAAAALASLLIVHAPVPVLVEAIGYKRC